MNIFLQVMGKLFYTSDACTVLKGNKAFGKRVLGAGEEQRKAPCCIKGNS